MKNYHWLLAVLLVTLTPACSATRPTPSLTGFEDIPIPAGLTYQPDQSITIEGPSAKAAHWVYRGRIKPDSLRLAVRTTLEANGWLHLSTGSAPGQKSVQTFEKSGNSVQFDIYEGTWYTYLVVGAARAIDPGQQTAFANGSRQPEAGTLAAPISDATAPPAAAGSRTTWERTKDRFRSAWSALFSN
ncbi:MAG TPA: hypothetical protein VID04_15520 [Methylomirabilota bacterium]|jgi:hypothetical protein